jgi:hypothetical protein
MGWMLWVHFHHVGSYQPPVKAQMELSRAGWHAPNDLLLNDGLVRLL